MHAADIYWVSISVVYFELSFAIARAKGDQRTGDTKVLASVLRMLCQSRLSLSPSLSLLSIHTRTRTRTRTLCLPSDIFFPSRLAGGLFS